MGRPGYLDRRRPRYALSSRIVVQAPLDEVFDFFSKPENLGLITPPRMKFRITAFSGAMREGTLISYTLRLGFLPVRWRTRIESWSPARSFVDAQLSGPYHCWWHEHTFTPDGPSRTIMEDRVLYTPPLGLLGRVVNRLFISNALRDIFVFRADAIARRFGPGAGSSGAIVGKPARIAS